MNIKEKVLVLKFNEKTKAERVKCFGENKNEKE